MLVVFVAATAASFSAFAQDPHPGRDVDGTMVAYRQPIPGSEIGIEMIPIPGGTIHLGAESNVTVESMWIGKFEITLEQYAEFAKLHDVFVEFDSKEIRQLPSHDSIDSVSAPTPIYEPSCRYQYSSRDDSPASSMSQFAARQFTKWLSLLSGTDYRLPLESEWMYACRAGQAPLKINEIRRQAVCGHGGESKQHPTGAESLVLRVGTRQPNAWGIFDMRGNVAEFAIQNDAWDTNKPLPVEYRVHRAYGGCFEDPATNCRWNSFVTVDDQWWEEEANIPRSTTWLASVDRHMTVGFRIASPANRMTNDERKTAWQPDSQYLAEDVATKIDEGRGRHGKVDSQLPAAMGQFTRPNGLKLWERAR